jgi:hypothetical protein
MSIFGWFSGDSSSPEDNHEDLSDRYLTEATDFSGENYIAPTEADLADVVDYESNSVDVTVDPPSDEGGGFFGWFK